MPFGCKFGNFYFQGYNNFYIVLPKYKKTELFPINFLTKFAFQDNIIFAFEKSKDQIIPN